METRRCEVCKRRVEVLSEEDAIDDIEVWLSHFVSWVNK